MSSHHVVCDQQEPALFILDTTKIIFDTIAPLLEWSPTVLVNTSCLEKVISWGLKIDVAIGVKINNDLPIQPSLFYLESNNPIQAGLQYLMENNHEAVNIISERKGIKKYTEGCVDKLQVAILDQNSRSVFVCDEYSKWVVKGTRFKLHPLDSNFTLTGLDTLNGYLTSKADGKIKIARDGCFWITEML